MTNSVLKVFSYLPNPRVWKSIIAGRFCGIEVEVVGDKPGELGTWLWDFEPRPLSEEERTKDSPYARVGRRGFSGMLFKTDAFLSAHPFGTVPAAFSPDGEVGIFESNSILRSVARSAPAGSTIYGSSGYEASRIDSFLDAGLVFAREAQVYLLGIDGISAESYQRMEAAYEFYLSGIEATLSNNPFLVGKNLTIADISFVCDFAQFLREGHYEEKLNNQGLSLISGKGQELYPRSFEHMLDLNSRSEFSEVMGTYLNWYRRKLSDQGEEE